MEELQGMIAEQQQQQQQQQMMMMQMAQSQQQRPTSELERELHDQHEQIRELKAKIGSPRATAARAPRRGRAVDLLVHDGVPILEGLGGPRAHFQIGDS